MNVLIVYIEEPKEQETKKETNFDQFGLGEGISIFRCFWYE